MKIHLIALVLSSLMAGLSGFAQEPGAPPAGAPPTVPPTTPPPASAPAIAPAVPPAPEQPEVVPSVPAAVLSGAAAQAQLAADVSIESALPRTRTNEIVPLIIYDELPLADAVRNLARQCDLNFQFDPRVTMSNQPMVTVRFENVTAEEALEAVLDNYNMQLVRDTKSKIGRISFRVPKAEEPHYARIFQLKYSEGSNMVQIVKSTLSPKSSVIADHRTSQLIVTTTLKELESVEALIEKLDTPTKQVLIEAHLLETAHAPNSIKGIDWTGTLSGQNVRMGNNTFKPSEAEVSSNPIIPNAGPKVLVGQNRLLTPTTAFLNADGVSAVLSFLNKDSDTEVVATPRAVTLDNQMARLSVTRAFPIFQTTPTTQGVVGGSQVQYTNLGVILSVTPRIAADKNISLKVIPEVSNIDGKDEQTSNGSAQVANIYAIRRIETQVLIPSGATLVMGGLIHNTSNNARTKVPVLGDIPVLGFFFRHENKSANRNNLIIFITPTIVENTAFQPTDSGTEYLKNRIVERPAPPETAWDSAKPHDWTKPVN